MLGAIGGDIIGSVYEGRNVKSADSQPLFHEHSRPTDDTVLTLAVAEWLLNDVPEDLPRYLKSWFRKYPNVGFGASFIQWAGSLQTVPYGSWGNGSAMRVSPVGHAFNALDEVLLVAKKSAEVTHNHPEGIKGAQAVAAAVFLARSKWPKVHIQEFVERTFGYDLGISLDEIRHSYSFDVSCQGSVPQAIRAFLEGDNYEDSVRRAISIGGDSDTIACIAGGIAHAFYGKLPQKIEFELFARINDDMERVIEEFVVRFPTAG